MSDELENAGFVLVDQEFLDDWYAKVIANRPDQNIYKEGLIAAYEDLSCRIGTPPDKRIDSSAVKIRMRNLEKPTPTPSQVERDTIERCAVLCRDERIRLKDMALRSDCEDASLRLIIMSNEAGKLAQRVSNLPRKWEK